MAIEHATGTYYADYDGPVTTSGNFNATIPDDADCVILYVTGYLDNVNPPLTYGAAGCTLGDVAADHKITGANDSNSAFQGAAWVWTGAHVTKGATHFDWSWVGTLTNAAKFVWVAYKGVASIRSVFGQNDAAIPQYSTGALGNSAGDYISVCAFGYSSGGNEATIDSWTNAIEISEFVHNVYADLTLAENTSASADTTISTATTTSYEDGGIMAVVMVPAAGGLSIPVALHQYRQMRNN